VLVRVHLRDGSESTTLVHPSQAWIFSSWPCSLSPTGPFACSRQ
jgi:hypothetical protein